MLPAERQRQVEALFRQYGRGVGSYVAARVGGDLHVAEQVTSNVFLIVVRRIEQCRTSPAAWLWSIVRSELARHFRQHRPAAALHDTHADPAPAPPEVIERREMQARMRVALERLTEEQQRIVYLKFFLDVPNTDIAHDLGLSTSNVGVIVHRAVKRLRELMEEGGGRSQDPVVRSQNETKVADAPSTGTAPAAHPPAPTRGKRGPSTVASLFPILAPLCWLAHSQCIFLVMAPLPRLLISPVALPILAPVSWLLDSH